MISAQKFNDLIVYPLARKRIIGIRSNLDKSYRHPWNTRVALRSTDKGGFSVSAQINAGYIVRGTDPMEVEVTIPYRDAPQSTQDRLDDPDIADDTPVQAWLSELASLPLPLAQFRAVGGQIATEPEPVPQRFLNLGVEPSRRITTDADVLTIDFADGPDSVPRDQRRLLRAIDLVLQIPRPAANVTIDIVADIPQLSVTFDLAATLAESPSVFPQRRFVPVDREGFGTFTAGFLDEPFDRYRLATVYLLSPPGVDDTATPDLSWTAEVEHAYFRNLSTAYRLPESDTQTDPIPVPPGGDLGLGVGAGIIKDIIEQLNTDQALAEILLAKVNVLSEVWTL